MGVACLWMKEGKAKRALELLALILEHPSADKETRDRAGRLRTELEEKIPPDSLVAAWERGRARRVEEVIREVLGEGQGSPAPDDRSSF